MASQEFRGRDGCNQVVSRSVVDRPRKMTRDRQGNLAVFSWHSGQWLLELAGTLVLAGLRKVTWREENERGGTSEDGPRGLDDQKSDERMRL